MAFENIATPDNLRRFQKFLADAPVLVVDPSSVSRATIAKTLVNLGAQVSKLSLALDYAQAEVEINQKAPRVIVADYELGKRCGLELLQHSRAKRLPKLSDAGQTTLFFLVTGNSSQGAVARAAEEDVDAYIIKPFSPDALKVSILRAGLARINPSTYLLEIERGKKLLLEEGKPDEALAVFNSAKKLDPAPSLACFYAGQAELLKQAISGAQGEYEEGLDFQKIHYKCMVGLYEVLNSQKKFGEAYDVIKRISRYFPANPQRLNAVLRLAIVTQSYEDVERYYQLFTEMEQRNEEMIRYVCAALVVCGKHYLQKGLQTRAFDLFTKASITAAGSTKILRQIVEVLVEQKLAARADDFLKRFPMPSRSTADFVASELQVNEQRYGASAVVDPARRAVAADIRDPLIYRILIRSQIAVRHFDAAENMAFEAKKHFPQNAPEWDGFIAEVKKKA